MDGLSIGAEASGRNPTPVDRRVIGRAIAEWERLRTERDLPSYEMCAAGLEPLFQSGLALVEITEDPDQDRIRFCGQDLVDALGRNPTGFPIVDFMPSATERGLRLWRVAVESGKPAADIGEFVNANGVDVLYRCVFLPLSDNGVDVTHIGAVFSYRMAL